MGRLSAQFSCVVHRNRRLIWDVEPRTAASTFTQLLSSEGVDEQCFSLIFGQLTPSLPRRHLKRTNKGAKFETLKSFCLLFRTGTCVKGLSSKRLAVKTDVLQDQKIHRLQARPRIIQPGSFTGWGSEGVKEEENRTL